MENRPQNDSIEMDKVSIIIPVHNTVKYVRETIESALNQTYKNCEIIAVDDGSTDGSVEILDEYSDRIKTIHTESCNTAQAFNIGIKIMNGDWFKWLSSDDCLYPTAVEDLMNVALKTHDGKNCIYYGEYDRIDSNGNKLNKYKEKDRSSYGLFKQNVRLLLAFYGNATTSLIHKSAFDRYGYFNEDLKQCEDYDMWLRLCVMHDFRLCLVRKKTIAKYRVHNESITISRQHECDMTSRQIVQDTLQRLDDTSQIKYNAAMRSFTEVPLMIKTVGPPLQLMKKLLNRLG